MAQDLVLNGTNNYSLDSYIDSCVKAGTTSGFNYPDSSVCLYVKAAITANTAKVPGAPSREIFDAMFGALGA
jgi:hypothetical protein